MLKKIKEFSWGYAIIAALLIALGICFIAFGDAMTVLAISVGAILAISGIAFGIHTLIRSGRGIVFALKITLFSAMLISGITTMLVPSIAIVVISNVFCLLMILDGGFKLRTAIDKVGFRNPFWWIFTSLSLLVIGSAFLMSKTALDTATLSILLGIILIADGVENLLCAFMKSTPNEDENTEEAK